MLRLTYIACLLLLIYGRFLQHVSIRRYHLQERYVSEITKKGYWVVCVFVCMCVSRVYVFVSVMCVFVFVVCVGLCVCVCCVCVCCGVCVWFIYKSDFHLKSRKDDYFLTFL